MSNNNPFEIVIVVVAIILIGLAAFGAVAPSFIVGIDDSRIAKAPEFPVLPDLGGQGNQTTGALYPFSESHIVTAYNTVKYTGFNPDKQVIVSHASQYGLLIGPGVYQVERIGTNIILPWGYVEPISFMNGSQIGNKDNYIYSQDIINCYNGSYSTFIVDKGNKQYEAWISFSPLPNYSNMVDSWNNGHGFSVWMYGFAYGAPGWTDQLVAYLSFGAALIAFFILEAWYAVQMMGLAGSLLGLAPELAGSVVVILIIAFGGAVLMFLRGIGGGNSK